MRLPRFLCVVLPGQAKSRFLEDGIFAIGHDPALTLSRPGVTTPSTIQITHIINRLLTSHNHENNVRRLIRVLDCFFLRESSGKLDSVSRVVLRQPIT